MGSSLEQGLKLINDDDDDDDDDDNGDIFMPQDNNNNAYRFIFEYKSVQQNLIKNLKRITNIINTIHKNNKNVVVSADFYRKYSDQLASADQKINNQFIKYSNFFRYQRYYSHQLIKLQFTYSTYIKSFSQWQHLYKQYKKFSLAQSKEMDVEILTQLALNYPNKEDIPRFFRIKMSNFFEKNKITTHFMMKMMRDKGEKGIKNLLQRMKRSDSSFQRFSKSTLNAFCHYLCVIFENGNQTIKPPKFILHDLGIKRNKINYESNYMHHLGTSWLNYETFHYKNNKVNINLDSQQIDTNNLWNYTKLGYSQRYLLGIKIIIVENNKTKNKNNAFRGSDFIPHKSIFKMICSSGNHPYETIRIIDKRNELKKQATIKQLKKQIKIETLQCNHCKQKMDQVYICKNCYLSKKHKLRKYSHKYGKFILTSKAYYCSRKCQKRDWQSHKTLCMMRKVKFIVKLQL